MVTAREIHVHITLGIWVVRNFATPAFSIWCPVRETYVSTRFSHVCVKNPVIFTCIYTFNK